MNSVKLQDINLLIVHGKDGVSDRQNTIVNILKGRVHGAGGKLNIKYEPFNSGKIKGSTWDMVFVDEVSSLVDQ